MTDKPLEWRKVADSVVGIDQSSGVIYMAWKNTAAWAYCALGHINNIPGPYDGTIETAKQRCEEHRRKVREVSQ